MRILVLLTAAAALLFSCQGNTKPADAAAAPGTPSKSDLSYDLGVLVGNNLKTTHLGIDYDAFVNGLKDVIEKNAPKVDLEKASNAVKPAVEQAQADYNKKLGADNAAAETKFLADNGKKTGVKTTASGLQYEVITEGTGAKPKSTDTVKVDYEGKLLDGTVFDSSIERKTPAEFPLNQVIPGWTEAVQLMTVGSKYKFYIPSKLAYGEQGAGQKIGPNATLVFEVTLLAIQTPTPTPAPAKK